MIPSLSPWTLVSIAVAYMYTIMDSNMKPQALTHSLSILGSQKL